ncbi:MAG: D-alanine--D-alanine ligase [Bacilli bacterium]|nr:D-alanine--D-alanine ligase [Bacilli bacterium]
MNIGVIFGGRSVEHDISIITGLQVIHNLDHNKYNIYPIYISKTNDVYYSKKFIDIEYFKKIKKIKSKYLIFKNVGGIGFLNVFKKFQNKKKIDLIFNCTHGQGVEDGTISSILDFLNIPYTSSGLLSSSISQDKDMTKRILKTIGVPVLDHIVLKDSERDKIFEKTKDLKYPVIIKPAHLGSSIGISCVNNQIELIDKIKLAFIYDDKIIIERKLTNFKEYSIACYKRKDHYQTSSIEVIDKENSIFDFNEKYINHHKDINHNYLENETLQNTLKKHTIDAYMLLEMNGIVRFDYLESEGNVYLNEINTIPGALSNYMYKDQISFKLLLDEQIREAIYVHNRKNKYLRNFESSVLTKNKIVFKK